MRHPSLVVKASLFMAIMVLLLSSVYVTISLQREKSLYDNELKRLEITLTGQMQLESEAVAVAIKNDSLKMDAYLADPVNKRVQKAVQTMADGELIANSYVFEPVKEGSSKTKILFTSLSENLPDFVPLSEYDMPAIFQNAYNKMKTEGSAFSDSYDDQYGSWITVMSPIKDASGKMIAVFAVDFDYGMVKADQNKAMMRMIWISLSVVILFIVIMSVLVRFALLRLRRVSELSAKVAQGDLTVSMAVSSKDEVGKVAAHFNEMIGNLRSLLQNIKYTAGQVRESSDGLLLSSEQTAKATNEVAESIEEVASGSETQLQSAEESKRAMEEMAVGIQRIAESSAAVSELALEASRDAESGNVVIQRTVSQMNKIDATVTDTVGMLHELDRRSAEIRHIVEAIGDIANQTNLLALNASIEAARAGEHGKGFAVVAQEVRKLAEKSRESSEQIAELLTGIADGTKHAVLAMEGGAVEVKAGTEIAAEAGTAFQRIVGSIQHVSFQVQEVSAASEQMSAGSEQIAASLEELARIAKTASENTQNVAASSEEQLAAMEDIAGSASNLRQMAVVLQEELGKFKL